MNESCPWNKLADHPPVVGRRCLVYMPTTARGPQTITVSTFTSIGGWWLVSLSRQDDITHWMDIPGPPVG